MLPFLAWNPVAFVSNVGGALLVHHNVWGRNIWHDIFSFEPATFGLVPFIPVSELKDLKREIADEDEPVGATEAAL